MVPRVKDNNLHETLKTVSLDFDEEWAREGRQGNFTISKRITLSFPGRLSSICLSICKLCTLLFSPEQQG